MVTTLCDELTLHSIYIHTDLSFKQGGRGRNLSKCPSYSMSQLLYLNDLNKYFSLEGCITCIIVAVVSERLQ